MITSTSSPVAQPNAPPTVAEIIHRLARRERQTLAQLLSGRSDKEAAAALGISPHTVHVYVRRIYRDFGVNSRPELLSRVLVDVILNMTEPRGTVQGTTEN